MQNIATVKLRDIDQRATVPAPVEQPSGGMGFEWLEAVDAHPSWKLCPLWGDDGWDFGEWPLWGYALADVPARDFDLPDRPLGARLYGLMEYVEGDVRCWWYSSEAARNLKAARLALFCWKHSGRGPGLEGLAGPVEDWPHSMLRPTGVAAS